jgi:hypothetical protein
MPLLIPASRGINDRGARDGLYAGGVDYSVESAAGLRCPRIALRISGQSIP